MLDGVDEREALTVAPETVLRELADVAGAPIEHATSGGPGMAAVAQVVDHWVRDGLL